VHGIVPGAPQPIRHLRREGVVDQELQAVFTRGSSRSRTAAAA
jgi:hypothetical protein